MASRTDRVTKEFSRRLKAARITSGFDTTEAFAKRLEIGGQRYRRYERAETEPPYSILIRISDATGYTLDWLIANRGEQRRLDWTPPASIEA